MTWGCYQVKKDPPGMYSTSRVFQLPGRVFEGLADFICRDINKLPPEKYAERIVSSLSRAFTEVKVSAPERSLDRAIEFVSNRLLVDTYSLLNSFP